ncbi:MAG: RNA polymerase subunit sigma-70 [Eubacteriales bacterium]|nr:RNA polymerase subunit sigma-70 [Eubacteriales bacterium]
MKLEDCQKREILKMRSQNVPFSEIAQKLNISKNTIKSFYHRLSQNTVAEDAPNRCGNCGNPLDQTPHKKTKRFCDSRCRNAYWNKNRVGYIAICAYCGAEFDTLGNRTRKYCNIRCYSKARWGEVGE